MATVYGPSVPNERRTGLWGRIDESDNRTTVIHHDRVTDGDRSKSGWKILAAIVGFLIGGYIGFWAYHHFDELHYNKWGAEMMGWSQFLGLLGWLLIALAGAAVGALGAIAVRNHQIEQANTNSTIVDDTAAQPESLKRPGFTAIGLAIFGVILLAIPLWGGSGVALGDLPSPNADTKVVVPTATPTPSPSPSATPSEEACDPMYVQTAGSYDNNQVDDDFAKAYAKATADGGVTSDAQTAVLLDRSGNNAHRLAIWANAFGLHENPDNWDELVEGECLSSEGIKLHNQLEGVLTAEGTTVTEADAPADWYNTGVRDGVYGVNATQGIYGDRKAIKVTLKNGEVVYIMVRCGNVVFPSKPPLPNVPTDNPPPPPPPPPSKKCEWPEPFGKWPVCKDSPDNDPEVKGNNLEGGGGRAPAQTDPVGPPAAGTPPRTYTPPSAPEPEPAPKPPVVAKPEPAPEPAPAPTVDPAEQGENDGVVIVDEPGPTCNPDFEACE